MKLIFLDIDGVMNHRKHFVRSRLHEGQEFCPVAVRNLREVIKRTGAKIVISSTWRKAGKTRMLEILRSYDMHQYLFGITPVIEDVIRGKEIEQYLLEHGIGDQFVILDDDDDMGELIPYLVQCKDYCGFTTDELRERAIEILNNPIEEQTNHDH